MFNTNAHSQANPLIARERARRALRVGSAMFAVIAGAALIGSVAVSAQTKETAQPRIVLAQNEASAPVQAPVAKDAAETPRRQVRVIPLFNVPADQRAAR